MDELLHSRVEQLKVIDDLLERLEKAVVAGKVVSRAELQVLRYRVQDMITAAEREHAEF